MYVEAVQAGRDPHSVNTKGADDRITRAVAEARTAVRIITRGATLEDKIASGQIFSVPMDTSPLRRDANVVDGKTVYVHR